MNRSIGIRVNDSYVLVKERCLSLSIPCSSFAPSTFKNLTYGVYVNNPVSIYGFDCKNSEFINNQFGIRMNNVNGASVTNNDFEVSRENPNNTPYGLYALACNRYQIEGNNFTSFDNAGASVSDLTYGTVIDNSINSNINSCNLNVGDPNNPTPTDVYYYEEEVYRNTFSHLNVGVQSQDNNVLPECSPSQGNLQQYGLEVKCNDFITQIFDADISVNEVVNNVPDDMSAVQGACGTTFTLAGNSFSYSPAAFDFYIHSNSNIPEYQYRYHLGSGNYEPLTLAFPNNFNKADCQTTFNNSCPSTIRRPGRLSSSVIISNGISFRDQIDSLSNLIDGGDTQALLDDINNLSNGQLKDQLLDISPYLSDQSLLAYLQNNPPTGHLKQVILANSPISSAVMNELDGMSIPRGIKKQIYATQEGFSARDELFAQMKGIADEMKTEEFELIDYYLKDTLIKNGLDSLAAFLESKEEFYYKNMLFETYLLRYDTARARVVKDELYSLLDEGAKRAMELQLDISGSAAACFRVRDKQSIRNKADNLIGNQNRKACAKAEGLIAFADDTLKNAFIAPIVINTNSSATMQDDNNDETQKETGFKMQNQPNPYSDETTINVEISQEIMDQAEIVVFDVTGRIINKYQVNKGENQIIHKAGTNKGVVFYSLFIDGKLKSTEKMLILE